MITRNWRLTEYRGLSTDTKPKKASNGAMFVEMDTQKVFFYDEQNKRWIAPQDGTVEEIPEEQTAAMYSYNGTVLPALPEWDKEKYPYAFISDNGNLHVTSGKSVFTEYENSVLTSCSLIAPYMEISLGVENTLKEWVQHDTDSFAIGKPIWTNHNILKEDGTLVLSTSEPLPISLPITMYDGEYTEEYNSSGILVRTMPNCGFKDGDTLEITLDGNTAIYTAKTYSNCFYVGNLSLYSNTLDDDGGDILLFNPVVGGGWYVNIYTRTNETHQLTIKLIGVK